MFTVPVDSIFGADIDPFSFFDVALLDHVLQYLVG
jgi:hypothetical protein